MKYIYVILFFVFAINISYSQSSGGIMFRDSVYVNYLVTPGVIYGSNTNYHDSNEVLTMDIYEPETAPAIKRPLIIFIHGGGFTSGNETYLAFMCADFTERGYITATINYRIGVPFKSDSVQFGEAVYRAVQDARAAERYLRANATEYCIDTNFIFMGGTSAGTITALEAAWWQQSEVPSYIDTTVMGSLDHADNNLNFKSRVKGVINCWGAVTDSAIISNNPSVSVISFVGDSDKTIPPYEGYINTNDSEVNVIVYGSYFIDKKLQQLGALHQLKIFDGVGHGLGIVDPRWDTIINMSSNFVYDKFFQSYTPAVCRNEDLLITTPTVKASENEIQIQNNEAVTVLETKFYNLWGQDILDITYPILPWQTLNYPINKWASGIYIANFILTNGTVQTEKFVLITH